VKNFANIHAFAQVLILCISLLQHSIRCELSHLYPRFYYHLYLKMLFARFCSLQNTLPRPGFHSLQMMFLACRSSAAFSDYKVFFQTSLTCSVPCVLHKMNMDFLWCLHRDVNSIWLFCVDCEIKG